MRILEINDDTKEDIKKVKAYANEHKLTKGELLETMAGIKEDVGDDPDHVIHIHDGYRVVYSIEEQQIGDCHHLSVSIDRKGKWPQPTAVEMILEEFGMKKLDESLAVWPEDIAVNVLQKVE